MLKLDIPWGAISLVSTMNVVQLCYTAARTDEHINFLCSIMDDVRGCD